MEFELWVLKNEVMRACGFSAGGSEKGGVTRTHLPEKRPTGSAPFTKPRVTFDRKAFATYASVIFVLPTSEKT